MGWRRIQTRVRADTSSLLNFHQGFISFCHQDEGMWWICAKARLAASSYDWKIYCVSKCRHNSIVLKHPIEVWGPTSAHTEMMVLLQCFRVTSTSAWGQEELGVEPLTLWLIKDCSNNWSTAFELLILIMFRRPCRTCYKHFTHSNGTKVVKLESFIKSPESIWSFMLPVRISYNQSYSTTSFNFWMLLYSITH